MEHGYAAPVRPEQRGEPHRAADGVDEHVVHQITARLATLYGDRYSHDDVGAIVVQASRLFVHARIPNFVPILIERRARDVLRDGPR
jgi:hypothetical protein